MGCRAGLRALAESCGRNVALAACRGNNLSCGTPRRRDPDRTGLAPLKRGTRKRPDTNVASGARGSLCIVGGAMDVEAFLEQIATALYALPGIEGVSLGGSRAQGTDRDDSDWDLAIYYRADFEPQTLRDLGWPGEVSEIGGWGGGVFNGGGWLQIDGRSVDVHFRDLVVIDAEMEAAAAGRFRIEPLMFHLAGVPTYLVVGELAINRVLKGVVPPAPTYPQPLRASASQEWAGRAEMTLGYAEANHAALRRVIPCIGLAAVGAAQYAHAILAVRGEWTTNEKTLLERADLGELDRSFEKLQSEPAALRKVIATVRRVGRQRLALEASRAAIFPTGDTG